MLFSPRQRSWSAAPTRRARSLLIVAGLTSALAGCGSFNSATRGVADALTIYRPEVVQGNFVSREQVAALQPGMSRVQVRDVLGTPLLARVFHADRWDYVFSMRRQGVEPQNYRLTLFFKNDVLERHEGDEMPSEQEFVDRIGKKRTVKVPTLEATEEQLSRFPGPKEAAAERAASPADPGGPPPSAYPPLEPAR